MSSATRETREAKTSRPKYGKFRDLASDYGVHELPGLEQVLPGDTASRFSVVELGCGAAHVSARISDAYPNASVFATDLLPEVLALARRNYPGLPVREADAEEALPFDDESMDYVVSSNLFEHLHDERAHLREIRRVLRPSGVYFISTPQRILDILWYGVFRADLRGAWGRITGDPRVGHCNLQSERSLRNVLRAEGFSTQVVGRSAFGAPERLKLQTMFRLLPESLASRAAGVLERSWLKLPPALQPTIAMAATKSSS